MEIQKRKPRKPSKPCILGLIASVFLATSVQAQSVTDDLVGLGMNDALAEYIAAILPSGSVAGNNTYIKGRNQANSADINMLKIDTGDNTVLNSSAGDELVFQLDDDANRLIKFNGNAGDTALVMNWGDGGTTAAQQLFIGSGNADADDDSQLYISGGGLYNQSGTRGSGLRLTGNEADATGAAYLVTGDVSGANASIYLNHSASKLFIAPASTTPFATFDQTAATGGLSFAAGYNNRFPAATVITPSTNATPISGSSISNVVNVVATAAATANSYVNLPVATAHVGKDFDLLNTSAHPMKIQPDNADSMNTSAAGTAYSCTTGSYCKCRAISNTLWGCK